MRCVGQSGEAMKAHVQQHHPEIKNVVVVPDVSIPASLLPPSPMPGCRDYYNGCVCRCSQGAAVTMDFVPERLRIYVDGE